MMSVYAVVSDGCIYYLTKKDVDDVVSFCQHLANEGSSYVFGFSDWHRPNVKLIFHYYEEVSDA